MKFRKHSFSPVTAPERRLVWLTEQYLQLVVRLCEADGITVQEWLDRTSR